jgi:hypothetical protein
LLKHFSFFRCLAFWQSPRRRSRVVDVSLRWPDITLAGTRWLTRLGAIVQQAQGVPAITISMLLLDGQVADLLAAIARYRPDLVPASAMRRATAQ